MNSIQHAEDRRNDVEIQLPTALSRKITYGAYRPRSDTADVPHSDPGWDGLRRGLVERNHAGTSWRVMRIAV